MIRTRTPLAALLLTAGLAAAQPKEFVGPPDPEQAYRRLLVPAEAQRLALADAKASVEAGLLKATDLPFTRWLWLREPSPAAVKAATADLGRISQSTIPGVRPAPVGGGRLLRIDLRRYAPTPDALRDWIEAFEQMRFDPSFALLLTRDMIDLLLEADGVAMPTARVKKDGKFEDVAFKDLDLKGVDVVRFSGPHVDQAAAVALQDLTVSAAPVVEADYFFFRALHSIREVEGVKNGLFNTVWGGLYYEFKGLSRKDPKRPKETDEDRLFRRVGLGDVEKGLSAKEIFAAVRTDRRILIMRSKVTGKVRRVDWFRTPAGWLVATHDVKDKSRDLNQNPFFDLNDFEDDAREFIWTEANGFNGYAAFDGKGALQNEVPFDVAVDRTIPAPHSPRLDTASCISCHETVTGESGWKEMANDFPKLLKSSTDVFGERNRKNGKLLDELDRRAGQYRGVPDKFLLDARHEYAAAVLECTGPWADSKKANADVVQLASTQTIKALHRYQYDLVTPQQALREMGVVVPKEQALAALRLLLPPVAGPEGSLLGFLPEDVRIAALKADIGLNRWDWDLAKSFALERARLAAQQLPKPREKQP